MENSYPPDWPSPPGSARRRRRLLLGTVLGALLLVFIGWQALLYFKKQPLAPAGGFYFPTQTVLAVPHFCQNDSRWGGDRLGWTDGTLGGEGCAVTSAAMVLKFYGIDTDPGRLNAYLSATGGYTREGWIYWEAAPNLAPGRIRHAYEDAPSYFLIDWNLLRGNPVIVRLRLSNGITHFVVITGKRGFDYMICNPAAPEGRGPDPLRSLGSKIEALRYYERTGAQ